ncbi:hypothetical protein GCM10022207_59250 [Streptomyces lannensis]|uniref:Uncharacterized protein n=1 Tax=Streptomyces lannensis TaxID=766498 RepID=A0ABP7KST1_9ACTN
MPRERIGRRGGRLPRTWGGRLRQRHGSKGDSRQWDGQVQIPLGRVRQDGGSREPASPQGSVRQFLLPTTGTCKVTVVPAPETLRNLS